MSEMTTRFSIVLPCYNEAAGLAHLLDEYRKVWKDLPAELILVNNGSTDNTAEVLAVELAKPENAFARTVLVEKNRGYGHGIHTGLSEAKGEIVGFSHADLQCPPDDLFKAYDLLVASGDPTKAIVKGNRQKRDFQSNLVTTGMGFVASTVLMMRLSDINAQPKVFHRSHLERLKNPPDGFPYDLYVVYAAKKAGLKLITFPVIFGERMHGESKWAFSFLSRYRTIWNMVKYIFRLRFRGA